MSKLIEFFRKCRMIKIKWCGYEEGFFWLAISNDWSVNRKTIFIELFRYRIDIKFKKASE